MQWLSFFSDALGHSALTGIAIGVLMGVDNYLISMLGFALLFQVRRGKLLLASLGGLLAWAVYLALGSMIPQDVPRFFIASMVLTIYAEAASKPADWSRFWRYDSRVWR